MKSKILINYSLCILIICLSGNPAFTKNNFETLISGFFLVVLATALVTGLTVSKKAIYMVVIFFGLVLSHIAVFGQSVAFASIGFMLQLSIAILMAGYMAQFPRYFVRCMSVIAAMSLFFYFLMGLTGKYTIFYPYDLGGEYGKINIGLHTFYTYGKSIDRNAGPFWEPGAFAGYLAIALFMVAIYGKKLRISSLEVTVMILALGTTLSTMGYVAFVVVCAAYFVRKFSGTNPVFVFVGLPLAFGVLLIITYVAAESVPFLKEKILTQVEDVEVGKGGQQINRFGNALYDLEFFLSKPIVGWSANVETRVANDNLALESIQAQGNALTGFAVRFGFIGWVAMMVAFFTAFLAMSRSLPIAVLGVVLVSVLFTGEKYMNFPLIMVFMFLGHKHTKALDNRRRRRRRRSTDGPRTPAMPRGARRAA